MVLLRCSCVDDVGLMLCCFVVDCLVVLDCVESRCCVGSLSCWCVLLLCGVIVLL